MIVRNSVKAPWKISRELQSDLAVSGVIIDPSTVWKGSSLLGGLQKNQQEAIVDSCYDEKATSLGLKIWRLRCRTVEE